jgi:glycosyltransferase involved in cell wall biosynthesis
VDETTRMSPNSSYFVSVIVPLQDDADIFAEFAMELIQVVRATWQNYEIIFIDDASQDGTSGAVGNLLRQHECLRFLRLSRRGGGEVAISAGLDTAIGDVIVVVDPACDPPALVPKMVEAARRIGGIVFGQRTDPRRESWTYALGRRLFSRIMHRMVGIDLPADATLFVAMTRQAMNAVTQIKDRSRAVRVFGSLIGFPHEFVKYQPIERRERPRTKGIAEGIERGISLAVTNSMKPLRFVSLLGLLMALLNCAYLLYILAIALFKTRVAEGWITLSVQHSAMFLFVFLILAVLCEYVGRLLDETRERPLYYVAEERQSSVMIRDAERRNVLAE